MQKTKIFSLFITIATLFLLIYYLFMSNATEGVSRFLNSDQIYFLYLYKDLFINHGHWHDWTFQPDPFFFPDVMLFFLLHLFSKNSLLVFFYTYTTLLIVYYNALVSIGRLASGKISKNLFRLSALLSLLLANGHLGDQEVFRGILVWHFSTTVIIYLVGMLIVLKSLKENKNIYYVSLGLICFLTTLSDPMFFLTFSGSIFPALIAINIHNVESRKTTRLITLKLLLIILFTGLFALAGNTFDLFNLHISTFAQAESHTLESLHLIFQRMLKIQEIFSLYYANNPIICLCGFIFFLIGNTLFIQRIFSIKFMKPIKPLDNNNFFVISSATFCINTSLFIALFLDPNLLAVHYVGLRHFQSMIIVPVFLGLPVLLAQHTHLNILSNRYYNYAILSILGCLLIFQPFFSLKKITHYYPPVTQCLENYLKSKKLPGKNGISEYWDAHSNAVFSKKNINLVAVTEEMKVYNWISTSHDYANKKFNFVLIRQGTGEYTSNLTSNVVIARLGEPSKKLICKNADENYRNNSKHYQIYVYDKGFYLDSFMAHHSISPN